jgi:uncharacterized protein YdeI (YjbR/CyaY-like superfamily)
VEPIFFESHAEWRAWLEANHDTASEAWVGMWKARTGMPTVTWAEAVREALCFGWIDGKRQSIDDESHMQRFTPTYSVSNRPDQLPPDLDARLRENAAAAAFWDASPPSYRKAAAFYVTSAKREETREKRLRTLIDDSASGLRLEQMRRR